MESFRRRLTGKYTPTNATTPQIVVQCEPSLDATSQTNPSPEENINGTKMDQKPSTACPNQKYWMPDAVSTKCYDCEAKFTTFRRRHHCRVCGQIFCSKCCGRYIPGENVGCQGNSCIYILKKVKATNVF